jgi:hypothetical protein
MVSALPAPSGSASCAAAGDAIAIAEVAARTITALVVNMIVIK